MSFEEGADSRNCFHPLRIIIHRLFAAETEARRERDLAEEKAREERAERGKEDAEAEAKARAEAEARGREVQRHEAERNGRNEQQTRL
jgi:hypothetical protein